MSLPGLKPLRDSEPAFVRVVLVCFSLPIFVLLPILASLPVLASHSPFASQPVLALHPLSASQKVPAQTVDERHSSPPGSVPLGGATPDSTPLGTAPSVAVPLGRAMPDSVALGTATAGSVPLGTASAVAVPLGRATPGSFSLGKATPVAASPGYVQPDSGSLVAASAGPVRPDSSSPGSVPLGTATPVAASAGSASPAARAAELNREVVELYGRGDYEQALAKAIEARELARGALGAEHPEFATSLDNLAAVYKALGRYAEAEPLLEQAIKIRRKTLGENDPDYVASLNNLGGLYKTTGKYSEAEPLYRRALEIVRSNIGEENAFYVGGLNNLASLYKAMGNYAAAGPLFERAATVLAKVSGEKSPDYAVVISNLAHHYSLVGRHAEAEALYRRSLEITRATLGERHPQYGRTLNNLASLYESMGDYAKAEPLYRQSLAILEARYMTGTPDYASALNNLAGLYKAVGDYEKADDLFRRAADTWRAALGEGHPAYAVALMNQGDLKVSMGRFEEAERLYTKALDIARTGLGEKHPDVALAMQNLAVLYRITGRYGEAEPLYRQALEIWTAGLGAGHPDVALALHNLGALYNAMGRCTEAEPFYRQALEIRTAVYGEAHPDVAATLNNLAGLCAATGREAEALELMTRAQNINDRLIRNVFAAASESRRLGYLTVLRGETDAFLSLVARRLSKDAKAVRAGLDLVLRRKAIVAEAMAADRDAVLSGRYPDLVSTLRDLKTLRIQIAQKTLSGPGPEGLETHRRLLEEWEAEKEKLEVFLAGRIPEINLERRLREADRQAVAGALPEGAVLVELIRTGSFDFEAVPALGQSSWKPARYLAFVLPAGEPENISMIDLGDANDIDRMISDFRSSITGELESSGGRGLATKGVTTGPRESGAKLRAAVFDSLGKGVSGRKRIFLAPDGDFHRLSFAALPMDGGGYLIDEHSIGYVVSGRDVLRFGEGADFEASAPVVVADPDYDLDVVGPGLRAGEAAPGEERRGRELFRDAPHFDRLPGTRGEGERIGAMFHVEPLVGRQATKGRLRGLRSPRILHFATHGFFLPDRGRDRDEGKSAGKDGGRRVAERPPRSVENPLLRSGLALAGANTWLGGKRPSPEAGDGILTGEDATALDLLATELVVLSACETGLGEIRNGEGVFGLRRAFPLAGARTLVMSLWKVPDDQTRTLMEGFYRRMLEGTSRADALREAQLAIKAEFPEPSYWGAFVCQGDPGPLQSSMRKE